MRDLFIRILVLTAVAGLMPVWAAGGSGPVPDAVPEKAMTAEAVPGGGAGPLAGGAAGFTENRGQLGAGGVAFYSPGGNVWFTSGGAWFRVEDDGDEMAEREDIQDRAEREDWDQPVAPASGGSDRVAQPVAVAIRQEFVGARAVEPEGIGPLGYPSNFLYGRDPVDWVTGARTYGEVWYRDIYDSVDLRYHYGPEGLKYDLIVRPGGDPGAIRVRYAGAEGLGVDDAGDLRVLTAAGSFSDGGLLVYQDVGSERRTVPSSFTRLGEAEYGFSIEGDYDPEATLVIDPALDFCTYLGGAGFERVRNIHMDADGDIYLIGNTDSSGFPATPGVIDTTLGGARDGFVAKLAANGATLAFSTYIGGSQDDRGYDLDLDPDGNLYVTGYTNSASDFPVTTGAYDTGFNGGDADVFLLKLNPTASTVLYGTYIGGGLMDTSRKVLVDPAGGAYLTGETQSADFPTTMGAYDDTLNGSKDAFALRLTPDGSALSWSTYMGGSGLDVGFDISVGTLGEVTVMGKTESPDLPTTPGAYDRTHNGGSDMMVFRLDATGSSLVFCTYIGGSGSMDASRMAVDGNGDILAVGATTSTDFPTTPGAHKQSAMGGWDGVVVRLSPDGTRLKASTYMGTFESDEAFGIDIDDDGQVLISGITGSGSFRTTQGAVDRTHNGGLDAFAAILPPGLGYLKYSTFFGGSGDELKTMAAWTEQGDVIIAGDTHSTDLPATPGAFDTGYAGDRDIYIASFSPVYSSAIWAEPVELYLDNTQLGVDSFTDDFGDAVTSGQMWSPASGDWEFHDGLYRQKAGVWDAMSVIDREVANGVVSVDVTLHQTNPQDSGILFRYQDEYNCYVFQLHPDNDLAKVFRRVGGEWEPLQGAYWQVDPGVTYALKVDLQGERIRCFVNDTLVIDITDDAYSTGAVGLKANDSTEFDDFHTRSFGTADVYSQYDRYTFRVRAHAPASHDDIDDVRLIMGPDGLNVRLGWDRGTGDFTEISDPDDVITLEGTSSATAGPSGLWTLDFDVTFPWEFPTEGALDVRAEARGGGWQDAWSERTSLLRVETDLTFTGSLLVQGSDERAVEDGGMVLAGEELWWSGLTVVYEGTTDVFPPYDTHDILLYDSEGGSWEGSPAPGEPIDMLTQVPAVGDGTTVTYRLSITVVPPANDVSDVSYHVTVRNSALLFNVPVPDHDEWLTSGSAVVGITITSAGYGDVDGSSIGFSTSADGGESWSGWQSVPYPSAASIVAKGAVELPDGNDNLVMWRAAHSLDPEWIESPGFPVLVDSKYATFSDPRPGGDDVAEMTTVEVGVTISDEVSGVDGTTVEFAVSTDGGDSWGPWHSVGGAGDGGEVEVRTDVVLTRGDDNFVRWRCSDVAGNGPALSGEYNVRVAPDAEEDGPQAALEAPEDNATVPVEDTTWLS